jgi:hypothetical protein
MDVIAGGGFVVQNKWTLYYYSEQWISKHLLPSISRTKLCNASVFPSKYYHAIPTRKVKHFALQSCGFLSTQLASEAYLCSYFLLTSRAYFFLFLFAPWAPRILRCPLCVDFWKYVYPWLFCYRFYRYYDIYQRHPSLNWSKIFSLFSEFCNSN